MFIRKRDFESLLSTVAELREELALSQLQAEDRGWQDMSAIGAQRGIVARDHHELINACYKAYLTSPLAKRYVRYATYFTLGKGVELTAEEPEVQAVLEGFWKDPKNRMAITTREASDWLTIAGEAFIRLDYDPLTAHTTCTLIDPGEITGILWDEDEDAPEAYIRKYRVTARRIRSDGVASYATTREWVEKIPATDERTGLPRIVHVRAGGLNTRRGVPEMLDMLPWLKKYEKWLNDRVIINAARTLFSYDVTLEGASPEEINAYFQGITGGRAGGSDRHADRGGRGIRSGSIRVHSDRVKWDVISPRVDAHDAREDGRALKHMVACSMGIPEHWLGDTGSTNLATARALDLPTLRQFEDRQVIMAEALRLVLKSAVMLQRMHGALPAIPAGEDEYNDSFVVAFPDLDVADATDRAQAFADVGRTTMELAAVGLVSRATALDVLRQYEPLVRDWDGEGGERERIEEESPLQQLRIRPPGEGMA